MRKAALLIAAAALLGSIAATAIPPRAEAYQSYRFCVGAISPNNWCDRMNPYIRPQGTNVHYDGYGSFSICARQRNDPGGYVLEDMGTACGTASSHVVVAYNQNPGPCYDVPAEMWSVGIFQNDPGTAHNLWGEYWSYDCPG
jgi:hypothetical protein